MRQRKQSVKWLIGSVVAAMVALSACGRSGESTNTDKAATPEDTVSQSVTETTEGTIEGEGEKNTDKSLAIQNNNANLHRERFNFNNKMTKIYDYKALTNKGEELDFSKYEGKVLLIVNTASKCGFTPQFAGLEKLNKEYKAKGLEVIGFPCNQFAGQDPGTDKEIVEFCQLNFGVTFQMMKKIEVNGEGEHPIFTYLKSRAGFGGFDQKHKLGKLLDDMMRKQDPEYDKKPDIKWNFTKFLISKDGEKVIRFEPTAEPEEIAKSIEEML